MPTHYIKRSSYVTGGHIGYAEGRNRVPPGDGGFMMYTSSNDPQISFSEGHRGASYSYVQQSSTGHAGMPVVYEQFYSSSSSGSPQEESDPPPPYTSNTQTFVSQGYGRGVADSMPLGYEDRGYTSDPDTYSDDSYDRTRAQAQDFHVHPMALLASMALKARAQSQASQDKKRATRTVRIVPHAVDTREREREADSRPQQHAPRWYEDFLQEQEHEANGAKRHRDKDVEDLSERFMDLQHKPGERAGAVKSFEGPVKSLSGEGVGCATPEPQSSTQSAEVEKPKERGQSKESPQATPTPCKSLTPTPVYSSTITIENGRSSRPLMRVSYRAKEGDWETPPAASIGPCTTDTFIVLAGESGRCEGKVTYKLHNGGKVTLSFVCSSDVNEVSITPDVYRDLFKLKFKKKAPLICTLTALEVDDDAPKSAVDTSPQQTI